MRAAGYERQGAARPRARAVPLPEGVTFERGACLGIPGITAHGAGHVAGPVVRGLARDGVNHIVEVAFGANIKTDAEVLAQGGSIATYATDVFTPVIAFWPLASGNARIFFVGSDDVPAGSKVKVEAAHAIKRGAGGRVGRP